MDTLKQQLLIGQFMSITGASEGEAGQLLREARWEFETALSIFFDESTPNTSSASCQDNKSSQQPILKRNQHLVPSNTPATPPAFPETLLAFRQMSTNQTQTQSQPPPQSSSSSSSSQQQQSQSQQSRNWQ